MRTINSSNLTELQKNNYWIIDFIKIVVDENDEDKIVRLSTHNSNLSIGGDTYVAAGQFLGFSNVTDDLDAKDSSLIVQLSGVGNAFTAVLLTNNIEGSLVTVSRGFFNKDTGALVADPDVRWAGRINTYSITDDFNASESDKIELTMDCKSLLGTVLGRVNGRYTSSNSFTDDSMEFVPSLKTFSPFFGKEN